MLAITMPTLQRALIGAVKYYPTKATIPTLLTTDACIYGGTSGAVAAAVRYDIVHASGTTTAPLENQQANNGVWVSLGSYPFAVGTSGSVLVRNDSANGYVIADAVKFVLPGAPPAVAVVASAKTAEEGGATKGAFTVFSDTAEASALAVQLTYGGTGTTASDYKALPAVVTIPAGSLSAAISVQAFADSAVEGSETVIANVAANAAYSVASPASATVTILDPPLDRWKAAHFTSAELNDPQIGADNADPDRDGRGNFFEFAAGGDPRAADVRGAPILSWENVGGGPQLRLYYDKRDDAVAYEVEQCSALQPPGWTHAGVSPETYDPATGLFFQSAPVAAGAPSVFLRLQMRSQ